MPTPTTYKGLTILENASGAAGQALTDNFKSIADDIASLEAGSGAQGADTQVQYNNGGSLAGAAGLTYASGTGNVAVTTGDLSVASGQKVILDGAGGNDYIIYNAAGTEIRFYLGGVLAAVIET